MKRTNIKKVHVVESRMFLTPQLVADMKKGGKTFNWYLLFFYEELNEILKTNNSYKFKKIKLTMHHHDYFIKNRVGVFYLFNSKT